MPYYTLISRPVRLEGDPLAPWAPQFGDYDRAAVVAEHLDMKAADKRNDWLTEYRIIRTANARPKLIREVLDSLKTRTDAPAQAEARP